MDSSNNWTWIEWENLNKSKNSTKTKDDFIAQFVKSKVNSKKDRSKFIDSVYSDDELSDETKSDLKNFLTLKSEYKNVISKDDIDKWSISNSDLKKYVVTEFTKLNNKRKKLEELYSKEYVLSGNDNKIIINAVSKLSEYELENLLESNEARYNYLKNIFSTSSNLPKIRDFSDVLSNFWFWGALNERISKLWKDEQSELIEIWNRFSNGNVDQNDINILFSLDFLSIAEKREIITTFIPNITFSQAKILWLLSKAESDKLKNEIISQTKIDISWESRELVLSEIDDSLLISTHEILKSDKNVETFINDASLEPIYDLLSSTIEQVKNSDIEKISTFEQFKIFIKWNDKISSRIKWIDWLSDWSIIRFETKDSEWNISYNFWRISWVNLWNAKNKLKIVDCWTWNKYIKWLNSSNTYSYSDLVKFFSWDKLIWAEVFTQEEIESRSDFETSDIKDKYNLLWKEDIDKRWDKIQRKVADLKNDYEEWNKEQIDKLERELQELNNYNPENIVKEIDKIDPSWATFWLEKWTIFKVSWKWKSDWVWTIQEVNKDLWKVFLSNGQNLDFWDFIKQFEDLWAERISKINSVQEMLDRLSTWENWKEWWKYNFNNWKIIQKSDSDADAKWKPIKYLINRDKNSLLKIHSIDDNEAVIQVWELDKAKKDSDWKVVKNEVRTLYKKERVWLWELFEWIENQENRLSPEPDFEVVKPKEVPRETKFFSRLFQNKSIAELIWAWKIAYDSIEKFLSEWRDDHSARMALKLFWSVMPDELKNDLQARVQQEERKRVDEYIEKLKALDSPEATKLIETWLKNKNCPQHKVEAWMLFMYKEYWSLYTKGPLAKYRWTWLWYNALWWKVWDDLWLQIKSEAEQDPNQAYTFTEEELVYRLIKKQCWKEYSKYWWVKRRSRLHKEIKWMWPEWIGAEINKWYWDAEDTRSVKDINRAWLDELDGWTYANFVWWMKKAGQRWWLMHDTYEWAIWVFMTGAIYNFDQRIISKNMKDIYKWSWWDFSPIPLWNYCSTPKSMDFLNKVILEVCRELEKMNPELAWIKDWAESLILNRKVKWEELEQDRIKEFRSFWSKFWEPITRSLHMVNWVWWKYSKTDKIVQMKMQDNSVLKEYYESVRNDTTLDFNFADKSYMHDWMIDQWMSWLNTHKAAKDALEVRSWPTVVHPEVSKHVMKEFIKEAERIKDTDFSDDNSENMEYKRLQLKNHFRDILAWIYEWSWAAQMLKTVFSDKSFLFSSFISKLWFTDIQKDSAFVWKNESDILSAKPWSALDKKLDQLVENYLSWNVWRNDDSEWWINKVIWEIHTVSQAKNETQDNIESIYWRAA